MSISFEGIGEVTATFLVEPDGGIKAGDAVCLTGDSEVGLGDAGGLLCGVAVSVSEDGYAGVQISGLAEVAYSGTKAPEPGRNLLCADGRGGVSVTAADGLPYLVVSVDEAAGTAVLKL